MTKKSWRCAVGLATALLPLVFTPASATNVSGAGRIAFNALSTAPSGCKPTNYSGNPTAASLDHSMVSAMATSLACAGSLDRVVDLNSPAFAQAQFSRSFEASSAPNLRQTIGIASCAPGGCDPQSLLLTLAPSTGVLLLSPSVGGSAVQSSLGTRSQQGGDDDLTVTPEPGSLALLATGFVFMGGVLRGRLTKRRESAE